MTKKQIVRSALRFGKHRTNFVTCPSCEHEMEIRKWRKAAIVLAPIIFMGSHGAVVVVSECPKCYKKSWVHHRVEDFTDHSDWPKTWIKAVKEEAAKRQLEALREWGKGICHNCIHLKGGTITTHAWRSCIIGFGPPEKECETYVALE